GRAARLRIGSRIDRAFLLKMARVADPATPPCARPPYVAQCRAGNHMIFYRRPALKWRLFQCTIGRAEDAKEVPDLKARAELPVFLRGWSLVQNRLMSELARRTSRLCRKGLL